MELKRIFPSTWPDILLLLLSLYLSNGVPIETVSKLLGHTQIATTQIYARVIDNKLSKDMKALKVLLGDKKKQNKQSENDNVVSIAN